MSSTRRRRGFDYAAQWGETNEEEMELPSGKIVLVRPPNLARMAKEGKIPNNMIGAVEKFILGGMPMLMREVPAMTDPQAEIGASLIKTAELNDYIDAICVASIIEPTFVFEGEKGGIPISRMLPGDKFKVWDWSVGLSAALATFRARRDGAVESVGSLPDGETVRDETEQSAGVEQSA